MHGQRRFRRRWHKSIQLRIRQKLHLRLLRTHRPRQRIRQRLEHGAVNHAVIAELNLALLWMHIDIDRRRIYRNIDNCKGKAALGNLRLIGMVHSLRQHLAADAAAIDEKRLPAACALKQRRTANEAAYLHRLVIKLHRQQILCDIFAI